MYKISIIIPIYNSSSCLKKNLDSILQQTYKNLEIICINDGSIDNSETIVKEYQSKDKRIKLINKTNSGVSDTRNEGIKNATGDYIMFIDADDYIDNDYIQKLVNLAITEKSEIIISGYTKIQGNKREKKTSFNGTQDDVFDITYPKYKNKLFLTYEFNPCWKQLIKKNLITKNNLQFNKHIKYGEDFLFSAMCYTKSKKTTYTINYGYNYIIFDNSAMHKKDITACIKYFEDNYKVYEEFIKQANINFDKYVNYKILLGFNYGSRRLYNSLNKKNYLEFKKHIQKQRHIYDKYYKFYSIKQNVGSKKETIQFILVKYKFYFVYYLIKKYT